MTIYVATGGGAVVDGDRITFTEERRREKNDNQCDPSKSYDEDDTLETRRDRWEVTTDSSGATVLLLHDATGTSTYYKE